MTYLIDRKGDLVGYSVWPWDPIYTPLVGCFVDGELQAIASCDQPPMQAVPGPAGRWYFRMTIEPDIRMRVEDGDPELRLVRLEDGVLLPNSYPPSRQGPPRRRVEDLLSHSSELADVRLDGFAAFLATPAVHRVATLFLDYLGRLPDEAALATYVDLLNRSHWFFDIRSSLTMSSEFLGRKIKITDRAGSLITSSLWNQLRTYEPLGERRRDLPRMRLESYAHLSDVDFVMALHEDVHGNSPAEDAAIGLGDYAGRHGRRSVASLLLRDAVAGQRFMELVGD